MQTYSALPFAAGAILLATVTLNAANPKRNQSPKVSGAGRGGFGASGVGGTRQINHNRAMSFPNQEFTSSISSARRSSTSHSFHRGSKHTRTQSLNRNVPHTPSATTSMGDILHSRKTSSGGAARNRGTGGQQGGPSGNSGRVQRKPGHYPSQSLPEFTHSGVSRGSTDARKPALPNATEFLGSRESGSENRDQRLPII